MLIVELLKQKDNLDVNTATPDMSLLELAGVLYQKSVSCMVVLDELYEMVGIVTERDLVRIISQNPLKISDMCVREIMTSNIITASPEDRVSDTLNNVDSG